MLKCIGTCLKSYININDFERYFKAINDPDSVFFKEDNETTEFIDTYLNDDLEIMFAE